MAFKYYRCIEENQACFYKDDQTTYPTFFYESRECQSYSVI